MSGFGGGCPEADNTDEVAEVGHTSARLPQPPKPVQSGAWPFSFSAGIRMLAALGRRAEGVGGVGWASTQQRASKSQGHLYPVSPLAALAIQNECELLGPAEPLISLSCHPSSHFFEN